MRTRKLLTLMSFLMVLGLFMASCNPAAAPTAIPKPAGAPAKIETPGVKPTAAPTSPSSSPRPAAGQQKYGGILTGSVYIDTPSLDSHQESVFTPITISQPVMHNLVEFDPWDPGWKIRPGLAERWEVSSDGTKITFHLKRGINFHDGRPATSADVKFSIERMGANPPKGAISPRKMAFDPVEKVEAVDDYTLLLILKHPYAEILDVLATGYHPIMAKHVVEPLGGSKIRRVEQVIGTGPFKLKSYDSGVGWELVRNAAYYQKGIPYLDGIRYYIIKDEASRFAAFRTKAVLVEAKSPGFSPAQIETLQKSPETAAQIVLSQGVMVSLWGLWFNTRHPGPVGDVRVRKALHLAIDRQRVQKLFAQSAPPGVIGNVIHPDSRFAVPADAIGKMPGFRQPKDQDLAEAKRLLEEAQLPKNFTLPLVVREGGIYRDHATILIEELKPLGIAGTMKILDTATFYDVRQRGDFAAQPGTVGSWYPSPHFFFSDWFVSGTGSNYYGVSDERIDSLFAKQQRTLDVEERKKLVLEMERVLREEIVPGAPLYWAVKITGHWKEVKGYPGMGLGYYEGNRMDEVWLDR